MDLENILRRSNRGPRMEYTFRLNIPSRNKKNAGFQTVIKDSLKIFESINLD